MKTVVIIAVDSKQSQHKVSTWLEPCLNTWKYWCEKNGVNLQVIKKLPDKVHHPKWIKSLVFDYVDSGQIALIDSDTMVRWDCPDFFELCDGEFGGIEDNGNLWWLNNSIRAYQRFFPDVTLDIGRYINSGVMLFDSGHREWFEGLFAFYEQNRAALEAWNVPNSGVDQTIINFLLQKENINLKLLPDEFNQLGMQSRSLFGHNWQRKGDKTNHFLKTGQIWHFTGMAIESRASIMHGVWDVTQDLYV